MVQPIVPSYHGTTKCCSDPFAYIPLEKRQSFKDRIQSICRHPYFCPILFFMLFTSNCILAGRIAIGAALDEVGLPATTSKSMQPFQSGAYKGIPWRSERTLSVRTLGETKFARCDVHTVKNEGGDGEIDDWIFMEEMDAVNVAVVTSEGKFVLFEQEKYAIPGSTLSPVGGFIEGKEAPFESARREVMEELGLGSPQTLHQMFVAGSLDMEHMKLAKPYSFEEMIRSMSGQHAFSLMPKMTRDVDKYNLAVGNAPEDDPNWIFLGKYRTAANRGGGFIYTYLLKNAVQILPLGGTTEFIPSGDDEAQAVRFLNAEEIQERIQDFQEIKWSATLA
eukprot:CAMPEP_0194092182 /NCGR_PEP_ID=MMETSP0149-20130528/45800_1 /TAXON_ID=122233 /ORGANISM="Chaetoceros debilis, Strain MM31A-1" /LENGTH=334 /DNA_ID=CAMNT_0038777035 /DNA_START=42 /DNA_END=1042 /DNA_ORIENTATION=+